MSPRFGFESLRPWKYIHEKDPKKYTNKQIPLADRSPAEISGSSSKQQLMKAKNMTGCMSM